MAREGGKEIQPDEKELREGQISESKEVDQSKPVGTVEIDSQDIDGVGLHYLRRGLSIIPQEPFLLQGTLKFNVDPEGKNSDEEIFEALQKVSITDTLRTEDIIDQLIQDQRKQANKSSNKKGESAAGGQLKKDQQEVQRIKKEGATMADYLRYKIDMNGANLSVGQRQLICIARAIISKPKILLMDEATANIDQKTDSVVQSIIKKELNETTVITIAHRLITIVQYDKLIILENGKKIEEGSPKQLIQSGGYFCELVEEGGQEFKTKMLKAAEDHSIDPAKLFS